MKPHQITPVAVGMLAGALFTAGLGGILLLTDSGPAYELAPASEWTGASGRDIRGKRDPFAGDVTRRRGEAVTAAWDLLAHHQDLPAREILSAGLQVYDDWLGEHMDRASAQWDDLSAARERTEAAALDAWSATTSAPFSGRASASTPSSRPTTPQFTGPPIAPSSDSIPAPTAPPSSGREKSSPRN